MTSAKNDTRIFIFLTIVLFPSCNTPNESYCGNTDHFSITEIETFDVYKEFSVVKLGSFKPANDRLLPVNEDNVDVSMFGELKTLNDNDVKDLFRILVNYNLLPDKLEEVKKTVVFCYNPRNAILFFDRNDTVIGYIELCFECFGYKKYPSSLRVGEFCDDKFATLKDIFRKSGIQYGLDIAGNRDEELENLYRELAKRPNNVAILLAIANLKIENREFAGAIELLDRAIEFDPDSRHAFYLRGHSYLLKGEYEVAKRDFDKVLELNPGVIQAYYERALATIEIFRETQDHELLPEICKDLGMAKDFGDDSTMNWYKEYCKN